MAQPRLKLVAPSIKKRTVMPKRAKNSDLRTREYLTQQEIETLMAAARQNRYGHRDATMILDRLPAWATRLRSRGPALGSGRFR